MNGDEDRGLVHAFKKGDEKAFDTIFQKYHVAIYTLCYRFVRNESDARELTQDVFIKIYRNLQKFNEKSKLFTWVYRITANTCYSFKRSQKKLESAYEPPAVSTSLEKQVSMKVAIDEALLQLPERQRMCFLLRHYDGYSFKEIGAIMGTSTGAAKANHHHAVRKLRTLLEHWL